MSLGNTLLSALSPSCFSQFLQGYAFFFPYLEYLKTVIRHRYRWKEYGARMPSGTQSYGLELRFGKQSVFFVSHQTSK